MDKSPAHPLPGRLARAFVLKRLERLAWGRLVLEENGRTMPFGEGTPEARLKVRNPAFYRRLIAGGTIGAGESYMAGEWSCSDLTALVRIIIRNRSVLQAMDSGLARLALPARRLFHWLRRNTLTGSRSNIAAHYDLGNDFYRLFLDGTMTYSSAVFERPDASLREAQTAKYDRICRKLNLKPEDHVLEIGTGWGGFAVHAVENYGCRVTTTTLSSQQFDYAQARFEERGISGRIRLLNQDYRDLEGAYDKVVSIEMIEAVGHQYLETFFRSVSQRLKPDGKAALQAITITDQRYADHTRSVDFIKRYIFPGSCLVSVTAMTRTVTDATDLRLFDLEDITLHYAATLKEWRSRFFDNLDRVRALGFPESFIRMWEFYLCYCEAAFAEHYTGAVQAVFNKPLSRAPLPLASYGGRAS
jgi:cyclopropane-fatty-acyl-phospholipid synthase